MKVVVFGVVLLACLSAAQFSPGANEYSAEAVTEPPLKQPVVFTTNDVDEKRKNALPKANLVIGVISMPEHFTERETVRATWAQMKSLTDPKLDDLSIHEKEQMVVRFVVGKSKDLNMEKLLAKESLKYHDIVRVDVEESYFNLTYKTIELFKWADANYNFDWLMKCDDDSFVRIDRLLDELQKHGTNRLYMGKMWTGTPVDRRVDSYTPFKKYNTFAAGAGYVLSTDLVSYVVRNVDGLHKWPMEDVAVGMWLSTLDINVVDHKNFHSLPEGCDKDMIVQNPAKPDVMKTVFFNTVKGVPCHAFPDPFDPSQKNVTDHVLLELGIPKPAAGAMPSRAGIQNLMDMPVGSLVHDEEAEEHAEDVDESKFSSTEDGMSETAMNGNLASGIATTEMNKVGNMEQMEALDAASRAANDAMNSSPGLNPNLL